MSERILNFDDFSALADRILEKGNKLRFRANGNSMRPFIFDGNVVEISPCGQGDLKKGDIILCRLERERLVLHRLVKLIVEDGNKRLLIQGDALPAPDGWLEVKQVLGLATSVYRGKRQIRLDGRSVLFFARIWMGLAPVRPVLIDLWHVLRGIKARLA